MDFDFYWVIVLFIFVVLPLLEKVLKGAKGAKGPPPQQTPSQRLPPPAQRELPPREEPAARRDEELDRAAQMIPPDLWEILTGQRPPPVATAPSPEADIDEELDEYEEVSFRSSYDEDTAAEELMRHREREFALRDREVARSREERPLELPVVVSLETEPLPEPLRHAAFHEAMDRRAELAPAARVLRPKTHDLRTVLGSRPDLVRAIVLQEVLGPPKGLE